MPRNVRNFWIQGSVDGVKSDIGTGPKSGDGGFSLTILMREDGSISDKKLIVRGYAGRDGKLHMWAEAEGVGGETKRIEIETER